MMITKPMARGICANWRHDPLYIPPREEASLIDDANIYTTIYLEHEKSGISVGACTTKIKVNNSLRTSVMAAFMNHYLNRYMGILGWKRDDDTIGIHLLYAWYFVFALQWEEESLLLHFHSATYFFDGSTPRVRK